VFQELAEWVLRVADQMLGVGLLMGFLLVEKQDDSDSAEAEGLETNTLEVALGGFVALLL
jgi:hypothetical protein